MILFLMYFIFFKEKTREKKAMPRECNLMTKINLRKEIRRPKIAGNKLNYK